MNWNKGAKTKGRGTSFKGALLYYLHDKERATTAERVGFVELINLATDDPHGAWREMMATAEAADELKRRAGVRQGRPQKHETRSMPYPSNGTLTIRRMKPTCASARMKS